jgi:putative ABC transport system ATP-binding protein
MIKLNKMCRVFRTEELETSALSDIDLSVAEGEFLAIMGPSGCGKSTLLSILGMLDSPTSGQYLFCGEDISRCSDRRLAQLRKHAIGFVFQSFNLIDGLSVFQNVELPMRYQGVAREERKRRTDEILKRFEIDHRGGHFPQQLSGGQQQRVAVARACVSGAKVILADEPTGNLDSKNGQEVMCLLRDLNAAGTTIIMVTHSDHDAQYAGRVVRLLDGKINSDAVQASVQAVKYA